jgi:hypothetical protein
MRQPSAGDMGYQPVILKGSLPSRLVAIIFSLDTGPVLAEPALSHIRIGGHV